MRKIIYSLLVLSAFQFSVNAQWQQHDVKHKAQSYPYDVEVPNANTVWASVWEDASSQTPYTNKYLRTTDGGTTWTYNTLSSPTGYVICNLFPIDADTCYATMYNENAGSQGGLFKTTNGGATWSQLGAGVLFAGASFPNWVYFWNAKEGVAMGDGNGPGDPYLEIYTTSDYGATWTRVPKENLPSTSDFPLGITNAYCAYGNRIWFQAFEGGTTGPQFIYRSDDKGLHWDAFPVYALNSFRDFVFTDENKGVIIGNDGNPYLYRTSDGGETWDYSNVYSGTLFDGFISRVPGAPTTLVACSPYADVVGAGSSYSYDNGNSWTTVDSAIGDGNGVHSDVKFFNTSVGWSGQYRDLGSNIQPGGMYQWTGTVLPVTMASFTAAKKFQSILLNWQTATESNNAYFSVERSSDGVNFKEIGKVNSKGNSTKAQQYAFEDFGYVNGQNYYRLRQVNNDGKFAYSVIVSVDVVGAQIVKLYPNPAKDVLHIDGLNASAATKLAIINNAGAIVKQVTMQGSSYTLNVQSLPAGNYYLRIQTDNKTTTMKFIKQ